MRLSNISIQNYKALSDVSIDLGRVNVFIGPNGVGKTSVLEALGLVSASMVERPVDRIIESMGARLGTPYLYKSSFKNEKILSFMSFALNWEGDDKKEYQYRISLNAPLDRNDNTWKFHSEALTVRGSNNSIFGRSGHSNKFDEFDGIKISKERSMYGTLRDVLTPTLEQAHIKWNDMDICKQLSSYGIYYPNTLMLRGLVEDRSRGPVGLYGGRLPDAVSELVDELRNSKMHKEDCTLSEEEVKLCDALLFINGWYDRFMAGYRNRNILSPNVTAPNRVLKFEDRYMNEARNIITAYDVNEGALYTMFLACLLFLPDAPDVFAIDNVDYGLNPRLAQKVASIFSEYAKMTNKTILLTTHNPLVLDGLDITDDRIRLFKMDRNRKGHSTIERVIIDEDTLKGCEMNSLSHLWLTGQIGGMPNI